jgi:hypothetical protein
MILQGMNGDPYNCSVVHILLYVLTSVLNNVSDAEGLSHREFSDKWIASFSSTPPGSSPLNHHPDWLSDPRYTSYMANIENLLFHDHDHGTSMGKLELVSYRSTEVPRESQQ